jgi:hypothetical protein
MRQNELLQLYGLNEYIGNRKIKLVRHQDSKMNFEKLVSLDLIEEYQQYQSRNVFKDCEYILSYISFGKTHSLFYGLYKVKGFHEVSKKSISEKLIECGHQKVFTGFQYELEKDNRLSDLEKRLVIDWGKGTRSWDQWLDHEKNKTVFEIRPKGFVKEFPGYLDVLLSFNELKNIVTYKEVNRTWYDKLSSIYAIYLILDTKTGDQYIGSASGTYGLWGRWEDYANTVHGGNKALIELIEQEGTDYKVNLQYSILHVLSASKGSEIERYESLYKQKLGSRVFGLNEN